MNDGRIAASQEVVECVTPENFNLVWAAIDWAINAERFRLPPECVEEFRAVPRELKSGGASLHLLNDWMERTLRPETRRRIFANLRRAQFEAAKGAVQITISEETQRLLRERKQALFGLNRGSMEVTIRHLLEVEQCALSRQAFRLLEAFRVRHALPNLSDAVRILIDHAELAYQAHRPTDPPLVDVEEALVTTPQPEVVQSVKSAVSTPSESTAGSLHFSYPIEPVLSALMRCWIP
ncbi:MAG: hypothetical protein HQL90_11175 [Magnetococcales bacterium]|nr:hypothetical protein [Magnetococcales bacterium]